MNTEKVQQLEEIRYQLGLNRKQMAELLGVDPSAWTRWTKNSKGAPDIVYRALGWYTQLISKDPAIHESYEVKALKAELEILKKQQQENQKESQASSIEALNLGLPHEWQEEKKVLLSKIEKKESVSAGWKLLLMINIFVLVLLIMTQMFSK